MSNSTYTPKKYSLGLDIGVASVGWAVIDVDKERIHDLGVRIFEKPEDPQNGDSLAKPRRDARSARRRLKRRRQRLNYVKHFFVDQNLLTKEQVEEVLSSTSQYNSADVYELRAKALRQELSPEELLKVLYQIAKRRGYKSNRKVVEEGDAEGGRVIKAIRDNETFLESHGYETVGEALAKDEKFKSHRRNKRDSYINSFARADFIKELNEIIKAQKPYSLKNIPEESLATLLYGVTDNDDTVNKSAVFYQRPFMTKELIESMIGECTFEPNQKRAPRASYSFELFRLVSNLANLQFIPKSSKDGSRRENTEPISLSPDQIKKVVAQAKKTKALTYKKVRESAGVSDDYKPSHVRGKIADDDPFGENNDFGGFKAYHAIRLALKNLEQDWQNIDNEDTLNAIAYILTTEKSDDAILRELGALDISKEAVLALAKIKPKDFTGFGHLSIKALKNITPHIINGLTYDKACEAAGYDFRKKGVNLEDITNPVVKRAISQTDKVVNAVVRKYGKPYYIKVETARDLSRDYSERKAIEREQKENQAKNQNIIKKLEENGVINPTGLQIIKQKLYDEQGGKCMYSGKPIDYMTMLHDDNAYQIDHIVPFSRSNNDGLTNKVLVLTEENQLKGDKTPYEYMGENAERWKQYVALVEATYKTKDVKTDDKAANRNNYKFNGYAFKKKNNLLLKEFKNDSWNIRALNDTRYITRFVQNYLRNTVDFAEGENRQRVFAPNGTITSYLRKRWGLSKIREEDVLHHAADAAIVAAISPSVILQANLYAKKKEIRLYLSNAKSIEEKARIMNESTNAVTGEILDEVAFANAQADKRKQIYFKHQHDVLTEDRFPEPWKDFSKEVNKRTLNTDVATLQNELRGFSQYDDDFRETVRPIFVSRMPRRKHTGSAHKETIRSPKVKDGDQRTVRMPLQKVKRKDVENSMLKESDKWLYDELLRRLDEHNDKPEKAFAEPVYKNNKTLDKNGNPLSPVSSIKVYSTQPSGFYLNDGKAFVNNGSMIRLDVYQKPNKKGKIEHFFVPVYAHQVGKNRPTPTKILPQPKGFTDVDESFDKVCTLYKNDYVRVYFNNKVVEGYYVGYDTDSARFVLINHAIASKEKKNLIRCSPRSAVSIERYDISILGDNAPRS